ncbi:catechol 2,3-dioxygenase-like lactoylglutathione lyase family enzyme [Actinomadura hallensis]|uniref:Catechol 2,3-dioxygenase-like lactoylglutathione lyase family enzyme n=1 Tax=Actinomadura hallensis TaxID=337895 RepID=A0A543IGH3_9ACTN|nr:VOC family protein [Actinomadura hallensis]TQM69691.1 catechol 2,3-dioxygenase-like lactoylglutathione lyase family enzyme [Actinomadura hallensis]
MPVSEIHHVAMTVSDLDRAADFYEKALGYRKTLRTDVGGPGIEESLGLPEGTTGKVQYLQGPSQIGQLELIEWNGPKERTATAGHRELGPFLLSFQVPRDEIDEVYERLSGLGAECIGPPREVLLEKYGYITAFAARDLDGNLLEFVSLPSREDIRAFRKEETTA